MRGFNQVVAAQKERVDALVDFRLNAQEDQHTFYKMLKEMNDDRKRRLVTRKGSTR